MAGREPRESAGRRTQRALSSPSISAVWSRSLRRRDHLGTNQMSPTKKMATRPAHTMSPNMVTAVDMSDGAVVEKRYGDQIDPWLVGHEGVVEAALDPLM